MGYRGTLALAALVAMLWAFGLAVMLSAEAPVQPTCPEWGEVSPFTGKCAAPGSDAWFGATDHPTATPDRRS